MRTISLIGGAAPPALGQGTWMMGLDSRLRAAETAALRLGVELGMSLIDTAEMYGEGATESFLGQALGTGADAVIDVTAYGPEHAHQLLEAQGDVGAFIVLSSSSVYRDELGRTLDEAAATGFPDFPAPISESQAIVEPGPATYSTRKVALERILLDQAVTPVTILRPAAIHGLGSVHPREWWFVKRMLDGRANIPIAYAGASRFHTSAVANIAELTRVALNAAESRFLNIADPTADNVAQIGASIADHMGFRGRIVEVANTDFPAKIGRTPWSTPLPFVLDTTAAIALGYQPVRTYAQSVGPVCDALVEAASTGQDWRDLFPVLARYPYEQFDYQFEDAFFAQS